MALVTLPYPNMDFVPLDVLTANELDQLVANIEAINNAQITSAQLSNGAVTSAKLDNSDIFKASATMSQDKSVPSSTKTTVQSLSLPAGTWRISWGVRVFGASSNNEIIYGGLTVASADAQELAANVVSISGTFRATISNVYDVTLNSTTTVSTVITMPAGYASKDGSYLKATHIA